MVVRIRLQWLGQIGKPFYRIAVMDSRRSRDSRIIEKLGHYDPLSPENKIVINRERLEYWMKCGAQPSDTVKSIVKKDLK